MFNIKALVRDVIIIFLLTFTGGVIIGFLEGMKIISYSTANISLAVSNICMTIAGFTISGCLIKQKKFNHLINTAVTVWLINIINFISPLNINAWINSLIIIIICMLAGYGLSIRLKSRKEKAN